MCRDVSRYHAEFESLLESEGLKDFSTLPWRTEGFGEEPLYSRLRQLDFLDGLPFAERDGLLISAGAALLRDIVSHMVNNPENNPVNDPVNNPQNDPVNNPENDPVNNTDFFCMLSVQGWESWERTDGAARLTPAIWWTNPSNEMLPFLHLTGAEGLYADTVRKAVQEQGEFLVCGNGRQPVGRTARIYVIDPRLATLGGGGPGGGGPGGGGPGKGGPGGGGTGGGEGGPEA